MYRSENNFVPYSMTWKRTCSIIQVIYTEMPILLMYNGTDDCLQKYALYLFITTTYPVGGRPSQIIARIGELNFYGKLFQKIGQ